MGNIYTVKILKYMENMSEDGSPELAIELGLLSIRKNKSLAHPFACKCKAIYDKHSLPYTFLEKILITSLEYKLPSYFIVYVTKDLVLIKIKKQLSYKHEWGVLQKYQTIKAEIFIQKYIKKDFIFEKNYQYKSAKLIKKISNKSYFIPQVHNPVLDVAQFLLNKPAKREAINLLSSHHSLYYYNSGEFIIMSDDDKKVINGSLDSNCIYKSYLASENKSITSVNRMFVMRNCTPPRNYCHWISDYLPMIYLFSHTINKKFTIVFSEPLTKFQKESLSLIKNVTSIKISEGDEIYAEEMYFFSLSKNYTHPANIGDPLLLNELRMLTKHITPTHNRLSNIYISRNRSDKRHLINEDKLLPILMEKDFLILYSEELDWIEQVKLFKTAKNVVSVHGAALTNIVFSEKCNNLIEIFPSEHGTNAFQVIADTLGINYHYYRRNSNNFIAGLANQFANIDEPIDTLAEMIINICVES